MSLVRINSFSIFVAGLAFACLGFPAAGFPADKSAGFYAGPLSPAENTAKKEMPVPEYEGSFPRGIPEKSPEDSQKKTAVLMDGDDESPLHPPS